MTIKKYRNIRIIIVIALAIIFSQAIIYQNFYLATGLLIVASLLVYSMRKSVKGILADERDYETGGKAALLAMQIYCWIGVIVMFILKSQAHINSAYNVAATTLAFSICIFMLLYSFIFHLKSKNKFWDKWVIYTFIVLLFFVIMGILGILKI
ncbi:MAG: DUF2178 domain-containing protein [Candidatus Pacebacteria bacterium]|nr:DUF2178 domain-containing protein [Candidatus Paceibacterota bacterium]